jgi:hypothetical protein
MLSWALAFFIIAIIAAVFGFTGQDPVRRVRGPFPGLAGRGPAEKALIQRSPLIP